MSELPCVLVMASCDEPIRKKLLRIFGKKYQFTFCDDATGQKGMFAPAEIIIGEPDEKELGKAASLRWLQLTWAGVDKYARMKNFPSGVILTNASGAFGQIISEYVLGVIVALYRNFPVYLHNQDRHVWRELGGDDSISGKNALILGTGDIGRHAARALRIFGARITGLNRQGNAMHTGEFDKICAIADLDMLLPRADIVICALPGTPETTGLLDKARLAKMRKSAILINVGRGSLLSCADLAEIMRQGHLKGAALDVTDTEPLPDNSPLWDMENVIITPHIAGPSFSGDKHTAAVIWDICMDNLARYAADKPLRNMVDLRKGY